MVIAVSFHCKEAPAKVLSVSSRSANTPAMAPSAPPRHGGLRKKDRPWAAAGPGRASRRGLAAAPMCGGGAWPGFETGPGCGAHVRRWGLAGLRDRTLRAVRLACGDLAGGPPPTGAPSSPAPQQDQTAPGTPAGPQTQTQTQQSGPEPLGSGPPSMLSANQHRTTRVSSARPPCRPCRSSHR